MPQTSLAAVPELGGGFELIGGGRAFAEAVAAVLVNTSTFESLTADEVKTVAPFFQLYSMSEQARIFHEGDPGSFLCVVQSGKVGIFKSSSQADGVQIAIEREGRCFGEMALIDGEPRSATALCIESGTLLVLPRMAFDQVMEKHPSIALKLLRRIAMQLSQHLRRATGLAADSLAG